MRSDRLLAGLVTSIVLLTPVFAHAQPSAMDKAAADTLFTDAEKLIETSQIAAACQKFAESQRLDPQLGTLLHLADCYERNGQIASAWASFREAAQTANQRSDTRESVAKDRIAVLEPKLSYLTVAVPSDISGLVVTRDGQPLARALWGTALPIDPGTHQLVAQAPGRKTWTQSFIVKEPGQLGATIPALEVEGKAPVAARGAGRGDDGADGESKFPTKTLGFVAAGLGVAGLAIGAVTAILASSKASDADATCPTGKNCTAADLASYDTAYRSAEGLATGSKVAFIGGGILLAGGLALVLTAPSSSPQKPTAVGRIRVSTTPNGAMARWEGTW